MGFKDLLGDEWTPKIVCKTLIRYERENGIRLLGGGDAIFDGRIGNVLALAYLACEDQAQARKIDYEQFCERVFADDLLVEVSKSITEALQDFFRSRSKKGT